MRAALIINPACGGTGAALEAVVAASRRHGWQYPLVLPTTIEQPGGQQALEGLAAGVDRVLVAGGDGTLRQVAGAMATATLSAGVPIGVVPIGAANIVARNLGLPLYFQQRAADVALTGAPRALSVGWVTCLVDAAWTGYMPMLAVAGVGRDAQAIAATRPWLKRHVGWLAYAESGGRAAFDAALPMSVSLDDGPPRPVEAWSVLVAALPRLPLGVVAFAGVAPGDDAFQVLQVVLHRPREWWPAAAKGIAHSGLSVSALRYDRARVVEVRPYQPCDVQLDGDLVSDVAAMRVRLQAAAITVATP